MSLETSALRARNSRTRTPQPSGAPNPIGDLPSVPATATPAGLEDRPSLSLRSVRSASLRTLGRRAYDLNRKRRAGPP